MPVAQGRPQYTQTNVQSYNIMQDILPEKCVWCLPEQTTLTVRYHTEVPEGLELNFSVNSKEGDTREVTFTESEAHKLFGQKV